MLNAAEILDPLSVFEIDTDKNWMVYPNPVNDYIVIKYNGNEVQKDILIELYSLSGQLLQQWIKPDSHTIVLTDIRASVSGMFLLRISNSNNMWHTINTVLFIKNCAFVQITFWVTSRRELGDIKS